MKSAYNETSVYNLEVCKETKRWHKQNMLSAAQLSAIKEQYTSPLYHPNFSIRLLLFIATVFALLGVTGLLALMISAAGENAIYIASFFYGVGLFFFVEMVFIKKNHYKSGVNEAIIYCASIVTITGLVQLMGADTNTTLAACLVVLTFSAMRYGDLVCTVGSVLAFSGFVFNAFYSAGGVLQQLIPFIFIGVFTAVYFFVKKLKKKYSLKLWRNNLEIVECISLLFIYAGGNYFVVRELSVSLLNLDIEPGGDIPFALVFYILTVVTPLAFLYFGIKNKDIILLRVSLIVLAFSVFTFKYYYSLGHPEISLTLAGVVLLSTSIILTNYLKVMRYGFTRENILSEKWGSIHAEAFLISQTMGGNQVTVDGKDMPGGGGFGGGGSSIEY